jgi:Gluconate 2-dehydrogenase subunit 3
MDDIARRSFIKGASIGALAFTVGGAEVMLTAQQARAQGVPLRVLKASEAETLEAVGDVLAIGARQAGISHFVDQQLTVAPGYALLSVRVSEVRPPYADFYREALGAIERAAKSARGVGFGDFTEPQKLEFVTRLSRAELANWDGKVSQAAVYAALRNDAVDVVYGTVEGFERIGVPYLPHILPERKW